MCWLLLKVLPSDGSEFIASAPPSASSSGLRGNRQSCAVMVGSEEAKGLDMEMVAMSYERVESSRVESSWTWLGCSGPEQRAHWCGGRESGRRRPKTGGMLDLYRLRFKE